MFIFNNTRQEKGPCDILALRPFFYCATTIGLASTLAWSEGVTPTALSLRQNDATVNATGAAFKSNVSINSITLGERVLQLKGADFHAPVAVKMYVQSDVDSSQFEAVTDSTIGTPGGAFRFALSEDVHQVPGMTALDVAQSSDMGRMLSPTGTHATRMQVFLSLPERDNNPLADDKSPEVILMGAIPNGTLKMTPILAGNSDIPESLIFGRTIEINPSDMATGTTAVSMYSKGDTSPQRMCIVGLDLSGDLLIEAGHTVVGYQLECPAGSHTGMKLIPVGTQESGVYASDSPALNMIALGSVDAAQDPSFAIYAQSATATTSSIVSASLSAFGTDPQALADDAPIVSQIIGPIFKMEMNGINGPLAEPGYNLASVNRSPRQSYGDDGASNPANYGTLPPPPGVPAPGAIALLGIAAGFMARRRNMHTQR